MASGEKCVMLRFIVKGMDVNETIVAISTAPGRGGIGVVRLSGREAVRIANSFVRLRGELEAGRARFGEVVDETGGRLDECVVTYFAGPRSYTGGDVVEVAGHGSPVVLGWMVERCLAAGARLARPGEFTERAFLSGRMDLTQAEAVRDLIEASTLHQVRVAAEQMGGGLAKRVRPVKARLLELVAELEAGIDFAEDDVDVMASPQILSKLWEVRGELEALAESFAYGRLVREGFVMAIVGAPNAGKSSLFNRFVERERAIVTAEAGTTRDLVTERISVGGIPVEVVDTAGLRVGAGVGEAEKLGMAKSREAMAEADVVLLVRDATVEQTDEFEVDARTIVVLNKVDLIGGTGGEGVRVSALTGAGIEELRGEILKKLHAEGRGAENGMLTNLRQRGAVEMALAGVEAAEVAVKEGVPHEMVLLDVYAGLRGLDALTGETTADDVLGLIFSTFCIGK